MAIIIGAGTTVGGDFSSYCVTSANWGYNPNVQRLYCLGKWVPEHIIEKPTENVSLTVYAPGPSHDLAPNTDCPGITYMTVAIDPRGCGGSLNGPSGGFLVNSYSYSKDDAQAPGQESWSFTRWVGTNTPDYVIRGISEGSSSEPIGNTGIVFVGPTQIGYTGNVSAASVGRADTTQYGIVEQVGGGTSALGELGTGSASVPLTPLWI